jgi:hypothetical protein
VNICEGKDEGLLWMKCEYGRRFGAKVEGMFVWGGKLPSCSCVYKGVGFSGPRDTLTLAGAKRQIPG